MMFAPNRKSSRKACQRTAKPGRQPETLQSVITPNTASPSDCADQRPHAVAGEGQIEIAIAPDASCATKERSGELAEGQAPLEQRLLRGREPADEEAEREPADDRGERGLAQHGGERLRRRARAPARAPRR